MERVTHHRFLRVMNDDAATQDFSTRPHNRPRKSTEKKLHESCTNCPPAATDAEESNVEAQIVHRHQGLGFFSGPSSEEVGDGEERRREDFGSGLGVDKAGLGVTGRPGLVNLGTTGPEDLANI